MTGQSDRADASKELRYRSARIVTYFFLWNKKGIDVELDYKSQFLLEAEQLPTHG